jgi:lexA repressor|nr:MAG TPA: Repressor protein CI [Caudoviricetes sp.]
MLDLYKNIRDRRIKLGMSQEELAKKLGYKSRSTIAKIETGKVDLPESKIKSFADALNTTPAYLMGWKNNVEEDISLESLGLIKVKKKKIALLGAIACGSPIINFNDLDETEYIDADEDICADFALRCVGDSMINARIEDGDLVFIDKDAYIRNGDIVAVSIDFELTLKRVYIEGNTVTLVAENPKYPPKTFKREEEDQTDFRILGKAVAFQSSL